MNKDFHLSCSLLYTPNLQQIEASGDWACEICLDCNWVAAAHRGARISCWDCGLVNAKVSPSSRTKAVCV